MSLETHIVVQDFDPGELLELRSSTVVRTGARLERLLKEMGEIEHEIDQLDISLRIPGLEDDDRSQVYDEIGLLVDGFNCLRDAASDTLRLLILEREELGFREHQMVRSSFRIPDSLLMPDEEYIPLESET
jgi:hypothetical protein